ncbi:hypothetical protein ColTof3_10491 [Colletotrichum tofieldiae]|nr:hypothetical protein ColTof3_10491 [Colletotrichum tofieldiae]
MTHPQDMRRLRQAKRLVAIDDSGRLTFVNHLARTFRLNAEGSEFIRRSLADGASLMQGRTIDDTASTTSARVATSTVNEWLITA